eukprot:CAMPEP_0204485964 /NCGR_PEP_ID=MMETSP0471-20130131/62561_1 /ASSEMBLY_ACC=CAM_ASM_000602 /TAXON_ID=2969 /ORGANISM="Oxyrrhis marina" /LENGTH=105 /DNA_ID=CAMNT_0051489507 /DNA_START=39 /DNA_END=353 /DNA_ORIENTATION=+
MPENPIQDLKARFQLDLLTKWKADISNSHHQHPSTMQLVASQSPASLQTVYPRTTDTSVHSVAGASLALKYSWGILLVTTSGQSVPLNPAMTPEVNHVVNVAILA